jgi:hypothetical protein
MLILIPLSIIKIIIRPLLHICLSQGDKVCAPLGGFALALATGSGNRRCLHLCLLPLPLVYCRLLLLQQQLVLCQHHGLLLLLLLLLQHERLLLLLLLLNHLLPLLWREVGECCQVGQRGVGQGAWGPQGGVDGGCLTHTPRQPQHTSCRTPHTRKSHAGSCCARQLCQCSQGRLMAPHLLLQQRWQDPRWNALHRRSKTCSSCIAMQCCCS